MFDYRSLLSLSIVTVPNLSMCDCAESFDDRKPEQKRSLLILLTL